jgi:hypothetical protein
MYSRKRSFLCDISYTLFIRPTGEGIMGSLGLA